ncbi:MAG TPA: hypothetical protein VF060_12880 [Trebonia sp.]
MSGANQYSVKPLPLASTVTPPSCSVFSSGRAPAALAAGAGLPALTTAMPSRASATRDRPATAGPTPGMPSCSLASTANAATSIRPATIPAVVRTSLNPNKPIQTERRYPPRVAAANPAPAAAASRLPDASTTAARTNAAIT